ncbi:MAG: zinc dependent phospholipase C family protein [Candidatus Bathyarchaeota archaeon]|nr:zinc dependent phospholipase C family protein [Candidatus Bathyarchaeota archaeon]
MPTKTQTATYMGFFLCVVFLASFSCPKTVAWSNGGYSVDPAEPGYGTHDWIAQHALDWLPNQEKQFFTENLAWYLYGTELPDNADAADGLGDTRKHHVYFFVNGSLQDDVAAVRAQEEYVKAQESFEEGNFSAAAMHLGMVAHYVSDVAVFGHVMGAAADWGAEEHHSTYESYVQRRTEVYESEFNAYLTFDGNLTQTSAYDAALTAAYACTFGSENLYNCTYMDASYNWSDPAYKNQTGQALNQAANAVADIMHTFYTQTVIPEFPTTYSLGALILAASILAFTTKKMHSKKHIATKP